jgi:NAD+ synthase
MDITPAFSPDWLRLDPAEETARICERLRAQMLSPLHRRGLVLGVSGGVDSAVTAALAVRAIGGKRVFALSMPERHSDPDTMRLSALVADRLGLSCHLEEITGILEAAGFYRRYDEAVRRVIPEYGDGWSSKLVVDARSENTGFQLFALVARHPDGDLLQKQLPLQAYLEIVAATNFKQRIRKMLEYYHADRLNYAVAGTPNRLEFDQGFFVKGGDGLADVKPIAHLYKSQVYQLASYLEVPDEIINRPPTTDTYSLAQGQDEFYFALPLAQLDLCLYGKNHSVPAAAVAAAAALSPERVEQVYREIDSRRKGTRYLHQHPLLAAQVPEIAADQITVQHLPAVAGSAIHRPE